MKAGELFEVNGGWLLCGRELALRTELVQSVSVEQAAAVNIPQRPVVYQRPVVFDNGALGSFPAPGEWYQLELKYSSRSAPVVLYVGTEKECRCKLGSLARKLRDSGNGQ